MKQVVLYHPQIPQNTGNVVRTCAVTGASLRLVPPLGFSISDRDLKRAGLDYWEGVDVQLIENEEEWLSLNGRSCIFFSSKAQKWHTDVVYKQDAILVFGSETQGLPEQWRERYPDQFVRMPMLPGKRCLNLATAVAIALYETWRQQQFICAV